MIETRYTLPAILAASAHLALFFATGQPPVRASAPLVPAATPPALTEVATPPEPDPTIEITDRRLDAGTPVPSVTEILDPNPIQRDFTITPDPTPPISRSTLVAIPKHPIVTDVGIRDHRSTPIPGLEALDRVPRAQAQPAPQYPLHLRSSGIQGTAVIHFVVNKSGQVVSAEVVEASRPEFGDAAVKAVLHWRFEPGRQKGVTVPFQMVVPIQFSISDDGT